MANDKPLFAPTWLENRNRENKLGDRSASVTRVRQEVENIYATTNRVREELEEGIGGVQSGLENLDSTVSTVSSNVTGLQGDVTGLQGDVSSLQSGKVDRTGDTMSGKLVFSGSSTTRASFTVPTGDAPVSPVEGDVYNLNVYATEDRGLHRRTANSENVQLWDSENVRYTEHIYSFGTMFSIRFPNGVAHMWGRRNMGGLKGNGIGTRDNPWRTDALDVEFPSNFWAGAPVVVVTPEVDTNTDVDRAVSISHRVVTTSKISFLQIYSLKETLSIEPTCYAHWHATGLWE